MRQIKTYLLCISLAVLMGSSHALATVPQGSYQVQIVAADMCCKGCVQKVAGQLYAAPGVTGVKANLKDRTVVVTVSQQKGATLEQLWQAVAAGKGGPTKLTTAGATFTLTPPESLEKSQLPSASTSYVVVENLNHEGRAQKIANQLYATQGVEKVNAGAQQNTLVVTSQQEISPWVLIGAVTGVQERPMAIVGSYGRFDIEWSAPNTSRTNQQAHQPNNQGIQR
ncbi:heavy-metal-associated domain-containing protein [Bythopirellula goksoeyrii]|uniref:Heavy-metal-associated domain protein n=1 Tax=Bythopirellula goksoeyrii TaxID=1400387 RepID=A0A5B9QG32_9BACT|nr:heavy-metal-associated domain-containing protein [Bythopirellula goksoeyrii]QEG35886.1 Heavy-metal-associated domain protein [Bythopirellula goksoeyrii]